MPRQEYESDRKRRKNKPSMRVHHSIRNHPRYAGVFADPMHRAVILGLWLIASERHASKTGNRVTLTHGDVLWVTGCAAIGPGIRRLTTSCTAMGYALTKQTESRLTTYTIEIRNFARKQGHDSVVPPPPAEITTPHLRASESESESESESDSDGVGNNSLSGSGKNEEENEEEERGGLTDLTGTGGPPGGPPEGAPVRQDRAVLPPPRRLSLERLRDLWNEFADAHGGVRRMETRPDADKDNLRLFLVAIQKYPFESDWVEAMETGYESDFHMSRKFSFSYLIRCIDKLVADCPVRKPPVRSVWDVKIAQGVKEPEPDRGLISIEDLMAGMAGGGNG